VAGILNYFDEALVFVILKDNHPLNLIFQKLPMVIENFYFDTFKFQVLNNFPEDFIYNYLVTDRATDFSITISFYGVPSRTDCNYRSNVECVNFMWDAYERFSIKKSLPSPFSRLTTRPHHCA